MNLKSKDIARNPYSSCPAGAFTVPSNQDSLLELLCFAEFQDPNKHRLPVYWLRSQRTFGVNSMQRAHSGNLYGQPVPRFTWKVTQRNIRVAGPLHFRSDTISISRCGVLCSKDTVCKCTLGSFQNAQFASTCIVF